MPQLICHSGVLSAKNAKLKRRVPNPPMPPGHMRVFLATFRGMPTANAEGYMESEGSVGKCQKYQCPSPRRPPYTHARTH